MRSNATYSASDNRSRPTLFCSALDSAVSPAARWVLLARSGCALIKATRSSGAARCTASFIASNNGFTPANGRMDAACSAIHGEYSKTFESAATKSSLLHTFKSESVFCDMLAALPDISGICGEMRQIGMPVLRDLQPRRHPDPYMAHDVVEKPPQRRRAARTSDHATVQADRHHPGRRLPFAIEHIQPLLQLRH